MSDRSDQEVKRASLKASSDTTMSRQRRAESTLSIRKNKRMESVMKRRLTDRPAAAGSNNNNNNNTEEGEYTFEDSSSSSQIEAEKERVVFQPELLPGWTESVLRGRLEEALEATRNFRKILSIEHRPPIQQVIDCRIVPRLVTFLKYRENTDLQLEAAWALTNIASGSSSQTQVVVDAEAVPVFIRLIASPNAEVSEQCVWALGNIAGDSARLRDYVISQGLIAPLLKAIESTKSYRMLRHATWTLSNLCRGSPPASYDVLRPVVPTLTRLLGCKDQEVVQDAAWAFSYLSEARRASVASKHSILNDLVKCRVPQRMVQLLESGTQDLQIPSLRTIGNIATGNDTQTDAILDAGCLAPLSKVLLHGKRGMQKEAAWTLSNITAGNIAQIQRVIESGCINTLLHTVFSAEFAIRKEAAWAVANAVGGGTGKQILALANFPRLIEALCSMLSGHDAKILAVCLDAINKILSVGATQVEKGLAAKNEYRYQVERAGGIKALETLLEVDCADVYDKTTEILTAYFDSNQSKEDQNIRPNATRDSFAFQAPTFDGFDDVEPLSVDGGISWD